MFCVSAHVIGLWMIIRIARSQPNIRIIPSGLPIQQISCIPLSFMGAVAIAMSNMDNNSQIEVESILEFFEVEHKDFCASNPEIHSAWVSVDHDKKDIVFHTIINELDFELERMIFETSYSKLPVNINNYYVDPRVSALEGGEIDEIIPTQSTPIYERGIVNA
jgi:hypothetical protein